MINDEQIKDLARTADLVNCCGPDDYLGMHELQQLCCEALKTEARYNGHRIPPEHVTYPNITIVYVNPKARDRCAAILSARNGH